MTLRTLEEFLERSLDDERLSRGERAVLRELLDEHGPSPREQGILLHAAFSLARARLGDSGHVPVVEWLEDVVKALHPVEEEPRKGTQAEALFFPSQASLGRLLDRIRGCRRSLDICVFSITHDRLAEAVVDAHRRGIPVRLLTDVDKTLDRGSDVLDLARAGVPVRTDTTESLMHNKFAIFDGDVLATGSYNWTRSATRANQENILITDDPRLVDAYRAEFDRLWEMFG
jgi:cardiolipin hydrolase